MLVEDTCTCACRTYNNAESKNMGCQLTLAPVSAYEKQFGWQIVCFKKAPERLAVKGNAGWQLHRLVVSRTHALAAENHVHGAGSI